MRRALFSLACLCVTVPAVHRSMALGRKRWDRRSRFAAPRAGVQPDQIRSTLSPKHALGSGTSPLRVTATGELMMDPIERGRRDVVIANRILAQQRVLDAYGH